MFVNKFAKTKSLKKAVENLIKKTFKIKKGNQLRT